MPETSVKPRPVQTVCCGQSYVWSDVIMGSGGGIVPPTDNVELREDGSFELREDSSLELREIGN